MKTAHLFFLVVAGTLIAGCTSTTSRLAHKWTVSSASYYAATPTDPGDTTEIDLENIFREEYQNRVYDIHSDGTFAVTLDGASQKGTWKEANNIVTFNYEGGKEEESWEFPSGEGIKIYHDCSMTTKLQIGGGDYLQLTLHPAPGEKVTPDY